MFCPRLTFGHATKGHWFASLQALKQLEHSPYSVCEIAKHRQFKVVALCSSGRARSGLQVVYFRWCLEACRPEQAHTEASDCANEQRQRMSRTRSDLQVTPGSQESERLQTCVDANGKDSITHTSADNQPACSSTQDSDSAVKSRFSTARPGILEDFRWTASEHLGYGQNSASSLRRNKYDKIRCGPQCAARS